MDRNDSEVLALNWKHVTCIAQISSVNTDLNGTVHMKTCHGRYQQRLRSTRTAYDIL